MDAGWCPVILLGVAYTVMTYHLYADEDPVYLLYSFLRKITEMGQAAECPDVDQTTAATGPRGQLRVPMPRQLHPKGPYHVKEDLYA